MKKREKKRERKTTEGKTEEISPVAGGHRYTGDGGWGRKGGG